jgi:hypothetical protein
MKGVVLSRLEAGDRLPFARAPNTNKIRAQMRHRLRAYTDGEGGVNAARAPQAARNAASPFCKQRRAGGP